MPDDTHAEGSADNSTTRSNRRRLNKRNFLKSAGLVAIGSVAGCSGDGDNGGGGGGGTGTPTSDRSLEERAREEDGLVMASSADQEAWNEYYRPAFEEAYPWAEDKSLSFTSQGHGTSAEQVRSEIQTGNVTIDITSSYPWIASELVESQDAYRRREEMTSLMETINEMGYPDQHLKLEHGVPQNGNYSTVYYNPDLISEDELPDSREGFADSEWEGQGVGQSPARLSSNGSLFAILHGIWGEEKFEEWAEGMAQNFTWISSNGDSYRAVSQGEYPVSWGLLNDIAGVKQSGEEPVAQTYWPACNPAVYFSMTSLFAVRDSPNPNMAELFLKWLLSEDGQAAVLSTGRFSAITELNAEEFGDDVIPSDLEDQMDEGVVPDGYKSEDYINNGEEWQTYYRDLGLGLAD